MEHVRTGVIGVAYCVGGVKSLGNHAKRVLLTYHDEIYGHMTPTTQSEPPGRVDFVVGTCQDITNE